MAKEMVITEYDDGYYYEIISDGANIGGGRVDTLTINLR